MMGVVGCDLCVECHMQSSVLKDFEKDIKGWNLFVIWQHLINESEYNI